MTAPPRSLISLMIRGAETPSAELLPAEPGPIWSQPGVEAFDLHLEVPRWDANGYRISPPHRSGFPRQDKFRGGSHWSR